MAFLDNTPTWLFWTLAGGLSIVGLRIAIWTTMWDRTPGVHRCPNCTSYLTSPAPDRCPGCLRETQAENRLYQTRRHWGVGALGALSLFVGVAQDMWPTVCERGWHAVMPGFLLAPMTPPMGQDQCTPNTPKRCIEMHPVLRELKLRVAVDELPPHDMLTAMKKAGVLDIPARLEKGKPLVVGLRFPGVWLGYGVLELVPRTPQLKTVKAGTMYPVCAFTGDARRAEEARQFIGVPPDGTTAIEFDVRLRLRRWLGPRSRWGKAEDEYTDILELGALTVPIELVDANTPGK